MILVSRRMQTGLVRTLAASLTVLLVAGLAACGATSNLAIPGTGPLLTVEMHGGLCPAGACDSTVFLDADGRVHSAAKPPNDLGIVPGDRMGALNAAISTTAWATLKSRTFTGECPVAFDGQELVFTFAAPGGAQRIASCDVDIDWGSPLFVAVAAALGQWVAMPVT
jgi:hypothetical protein